MEDDPETSDFHIIIESEEVDNSTDYWQKQCSVLYCELHKNLISGYVEPVTSECENGEKADVDTLFHILLASGITLKAFDRMFDVLKTWLEYRNSAKVTLKYEDGSTIELTHRTKSEALKLMEKHQQRNKE
ncbi:MAG: hypothetical protein QG646_1739 [Euryarchaeota archaeon]|nr:hypothetical protein [Euryarchaeota archaeon]